MKNIRIFILIFVFVLVFQMVPLADAAGTEDSISDPSITKGCKTVDAQSPLYGSNKMLDTSQAAMLFEVNSNTTMYAWNPDVRMDPASLIKIVTCMVVLENCDDIKEKIKVTENSVLGLTKKQQTLGLMVDEEFTVDMMLYALMVGSANDAATFLAEYVAGNQDDFVAMMNEYVQRIGCKDTFIVNCHGLYDERQYTTARDVIRMTTAAIQSEQAELFMEYFSTTSYLIQKTHLSPIRRVETTNYLITIGTDLYYDRRVTGGRTGITHDSKRSLVVTAESNGLTYVGVVLAASPTWTTEKNGVQYFGSYEEMAQMLELGFGSHSVTQVLYDGQVLSQFPVNNGMNYVSLGPIQPAEVILPAEATMDDLTLRFNIPNGTLEAPIEAGELISSVEVWYGSVCVAWSPVVTLNGSRYNEGNLLQANRFGGGAKAWVVVLIVLIVGAIIYIGVVLGMRVYRRVEYVNRHNRYQKRRDERRRTN